MLAQREICGGRLRGRTFVGAANPAQSAGLHC